MHLSPLPQYFLCNDVLVPLRCSEMRKECALRCPEYQLFSHSIPFVVPKQQISAKNMVFFQEVQIPATTPSGWLDLLSRPPKRPLVGRSYSRLSLGQHPLVVTFGRALNLTFRTHNIPGHHILALTDYLISHHHLVTGKGTSSREALISPEAWCALLFDVQGILHFINF
jgi:hypothetical protein